MFITQRIEKKKHIRKSKNGSEHEYTRETTIVELRCDNCRATFERPKSKIDPKRLSNNYFHVCDGCDSKRFAQKRGTEKRTQWELRASSSLPVGRL
jgi:DNA-directed RNA polymerase subunit RPC12/RpoP